MPGIILSALLVALGAILRFAVTDTYDGVDLQTIGLIVLLVGIGCFVIALIGANPWRTRTSEVHTTDADGRGARRIEKVTETGA